MRTPRPGTVVQARKATLQIMKAGFRAARAPLHLRTMRSIQQSGVPRELLPAFAYLLTGKLHPRDRAVASRVEGLRKSMARKGALTAAEYTGRVSSDMAPSKLSGVEGRSLEHIATFVSAPMSVGLFLYLCAQGFEAKRILELGTCAGISGCYLASAPRCLEFVSLEHSAALVDIARENLDQVTPNATVINADFDKGLGAVIGSEAAPFDLVWVDGHHEKEATLRYFQRLQPHISPGGLMLFDDITWSQGMREAWDAIRTWRGFAVTLSVSRIGMAVLKQVESPEPPEHWLLRRRLGVSTLVAG